MPSIPGKYQHYKNENIDDYFIAVGKMYLYSYYGHKHIFVTI